jgi:hypothetical protein
MLMNRRLFVAVVDILAYTPEEFDWMLDETAFIQDAVAEGVLIYESA